MWIYLYKFTYSLYKFTYYLYNSYVNISLICEIFLYFHYRKQEILCHKIFIYHKGNYIFSKKRDKLWVTTTTISSLWFCHTSMVINFIIVKKIMDPTSLYTQSLQKFKGSMYFDSFEIISTTRYSPSSWRWLYVPRTSPETVRDPDLDSYTR